MEIKNSNDKRFALLIDADNVSAKYIKPILDELSKYGTVTVKRIYGDWTLALHAKWKDVLLENSISPIQQFGYTQGKNATDSAMIIDAMDLLYTNSLDGFCIVSSDSDFTRLASRLRESGLTVIGMGEQKTPTPFRRACDVFTTLELLNEQSASGTLSKHDVEQMVVDIITENLNNGKATGLGEVGSRMLKRYPEFDVRSYGTNLLSKLLEEFTRVKLTKDHNNVTVELIEAPTPEIERLRAELKNPGKTTKTSKSDAHENAAETPSDNTVKRTQRKRRSRKTNISADNNSKTAPIASSPAESQPDANEHQKKLTAPQNTETRNTDTASALKRYIHELIMHAGSTGIPLSQLGNDVRARFKEFKVRDLGFSQMRQYLASVDDYALEKEGRAIVVKMAE